MINGDMRAKKPFYNKFKKNTDNQYNEGEEWS